MSADVGDALLGFRRGSGLGPRGKGEDSCVLSCIEPRQQHDRAVGKFERVMIGVKHALVDLAKDRNGVPGIGWKHEGGVILDWPLERQFGTRKYADSHRTIFGRSESSCAGTEVVCDELFAHFGWTCSHAVQAVVAHIMELLSWKPPIVQYYQKRRRGASIREPCRWPSGRNQVITSSLRCDSATSLC